MTITDNLRLSDIINALEVTLQIDGTDYGLTDINLIYENIYKRMQRQYQLDLRDTKLTDDALYIGPTRESAVLLMDNISQLYAKLAGYTYSLKFRIDKSVQTNNIIEIRGVNINRCQASVKSFKGFMSRCRVAGQIGPLEPSVTYMEQKFGNLVKCNEKRILLIMLLSYRLGLYELVAVIADIFMLAEDVL